MDTTNTQTPGVDTSVPTLTADSGLQSWPSAGATVRTVFEDKDMGAMRLAGDLCVNERGEVDVLAPPHTRDRVVYFREATMDSSLAETLEWKGTTYLVSDLLLGVKYGSLPDGRVIHPEEKRAILEHAGERTNVSHHGLAWGVLNWSEMEIYTLCGHKFEWTMRGVILPGHPRWRKAARERTLQASSRRLTRTQSLPISERRAETLDVYGRVPSEAGFVPQSLRQGIAGAITGAIHAAGRALGTGVAEGIHEQSSSIAAAAVEGAAEAAEKRIGGAITRVFDVIVSALDAVRSQLGRLLGAATDAMRFFVDFIVRASQALIVWALSRISGIGGTIIRGVADMLGFDFSDVDMSESADGAAGMSQQSGAYWSAVPGTVAKALLAAIIAAVVPKWGGPLCNWRPVVDVVSKTVPFTVGVSSMVEWIIETLQWCCNCFIRMCGGTEVSWYQSRTKETALWLARSYDYMARSEPVDP